MSYKEFELSTENSRDELGSLKKIYPFFSDGNGFLYEMSSGRIAC